MRTRLKRLRIALSILILVLVRGNEPLLLGLAIIVIVHVPFFIAFTLMAFEVNVPSWLEVVFIIYTTLYLAIFSIMIGLGIKK